MSSAKIIKTILFVCTGNTCRSPMAERIAKRWLATKFKVKECELEQKLGLRIGSGGLSQRPDAADDEEVRRNSSNPHNSPAAKHGIAVMKKRGFDTTDHRSRILTKDDVARAFRIYCVSKSHQKKVLKYPTACPDRVCTLGIDIPDPYGKSIEDYERCACTLEKIIPEILERDLKDLVTLSPPCPPSNSAKKPCVDVSKYSNGCGWIRPKETAREEEKAIYNATMISANTSYCHHYTEDGRHIVLHNLPSSAARQCKGVLYLGIGWSGKRIKCAAPRGVDIVKAGHDPCTSARCPFIRDYGQCPYMKSEF